MFGRVSRYDEHPSRLAVYKQVISRSATPVELPLVSETTGRSLWRLSLPIVILFLTVTELSSLYAPNMFLGWFTHALIFGALGVIVYHLCPPQWTERIEVNEREVVLEILGVTGYRVDHIPLVQYRGLIPITHVGVNQSGVSIKEYGVALRHADPTKTLILSLSPIQHERAVEHFSRLLKVKPLREEKFALHLKSKQTRWKTAKDEVQAV